MEIIIDDPFKTYLDPECDSAMVECEINKDDYEGLVARAIENATGIDLDCSDGIVSSFDPKTYDVLTGLGKPKHLNAKELNILGLLDNRPPKALTGTILFKMLGISDARLRAKPCEEDTYYISIPYDYYQTMLSQISHNKSL